jgi:hypothetical protein
MMKKLATYLKTIALLFFAISASAQTVEIYLINGKTGEKKIYELQNNIISIPVNYVRGWNKCTANAIKKFQFQGVETVRGELFCTTDKNITMSISCVAKKNSLEITIANLYDENFRLINKDNIGADGYAEITLTCKNL